MPASSFRYLEIAGRFAAPPDRTIEFDGRAFSARSGESLGITLMAHGVYVVGRSSKYHRPRGLFCGVGSCGQCVARVDGLPNVRLCLQQAHDGCRGSSQNAVGSARFDVLNAVDWIFSGGLDHHHLMVQSETLNRVAVAMAHQLAGLGRLPDTPGPAWGREPVLKHVTVAVVGAGPAGLAVAAATRAAGLETWVLEAAASASMHVQSNTRVIGFYDDRELVAQQGLTLLRLRADAVVLCTGGYEQPPLCAGNDLPGVISRRCALAALEAGVLPGRRIVLALPTDCSAAVQAQADSLAQALRECGAEVVAPVGRAPDDRGLTAIRGAAPHLIAQFGDANLECECLIWCAQPRSAYELPRQMGVDTPFNPALGSFLPACDAQGRSQREGVYLAGEVAGIAADQAAAHGAQVGGHVAQAMRRPVTEEGFA